jgi:hypothetical protein
MVFWEGADDARMCRHGGGDGSDLVSDFLIGKGAANGVDVEMCSEKEFREGGVGETRGGDGSRIFNGMIDIGRTGWQVRQNLLWIWQ